MIFHSYSTDYLIGEWSPPSTHPIVPIVWVRNKTFHHLFACELWVCDLIYCYGSSVLCFPSTIWSICGPCRDPVETKHSRCFSIFFFFLRNNQIHITLLQPFLLLHRPFFVFLWFDTINVWYVSCQWRAFNSPLFFGRCWRMMSIAIDASNTQEKTEPYNYYQN